MISDAEIRNDAAGRGQNCRSFLGADEQIVEVEFIADISLRSTDDILSRLGRFDRPEVIARLVLCVAYACGYQEPCPE